MHKIKIECRLPKYYKFLEKKFTSGISGHIFAFHILNFFAFFISFFEFSNPSLSSFVDKSGIPFLNLP